MSVRSRLEEAHRVALIEAREDRTRTGSAPHGPEHEAGPGFERKGRGAVGGERGPERVAEACCEFLLGRSGHFDCIGRLQRLKEGLQPLKIREGTVTLRFGSSLTADRQREGNRPAPTLR